MTPALHSFALDSARSGGVAMTRLESDGKSLKSKGKATGFPAGAKRSAKQA